MVFPKRRLFPTRSMGRTEVNIPYVDPMGFSTDSLEVKDHKKNSALELLIVNPY